MPNTFLLPLVNAKGKSIGELQVKYSLYRGDVSIDQVWFNKVDILDVLEYEEGKRGGSPLLDEIFVAAETHYTDCVRKSKVA
jgi:hypothetical protein